VGGLTLGGSNQLSCFHFVLGIALIAKYLKLAVGGGWVGGGGGEKGHSSGHINPC
jgi:hypothetical protein